MRRIVILFVFSVALFIGTSALAEEKDKPFTLTPELGYVVLTGENHEILENSIGLGLKASYWFKKFYFEAPFLYSYHKSKNHPYEPDAKLTLLNFSPGIRLVTEKEIKGEDLEIWIAPGFGVTFIDSEASTYGRKVKASDIAPGFRLSIGSDYRLNKYLTVGLALSLYTASRKVENRSGEDVKESFLYQSVMGRIGYSF